jgi:hypothetical protein
MQLLTAANRQFYRPAGATNRSSTAVILSSTYPDTDEHRWNKRIYFQSFVSYIGSSSRLDVFTNTQPNPKAEERVADGYFMPLFFKQTSDV